MSESLKDVIENLKRQQSQEVRKKPEVRKEELDIPTPEELESLEDDNGEIVNDYEEESEEVPQIPQKQASQKPQAREKPADPVNDTQKTAELIRDLQDNGIYRLRKLILMEQKNKLLAELNENINVVGKFMVLKYGQK